MDRILELARRLKAPVLTTFKAKGLLPDSHPHSAGVLGRSGTPIASWFMNESDLIVAFGTSFSKHTGIEPSKPIIQVDFDPMHLGKFHPVALPVWGEAGRTCERLLATMADATAALDQVPEIAERWRIWRAEKARRMLDDRGRGVSSAAIFDALTRTAPADAVIAIDVGNNAYSFGRYFEPRHNSILMSGYLGSIGFAFPAAMGAWAATCDIAAHRGRKVISISGDGGFGQYMAEFTTAVKYGMNITHILLNNAELGKISKEQRAGEWPVWQTSLVNPDFAAFAQNCGGLGLTVRQASDLESAMHQAFAHDGPSLVEISSDVELV
jgi:thiamine pyrophosphate-dependent acetolactate synthase large subunit-like protein